jgi:hypothetical protein
MGSRHSRIRRVLKGRYRGGNDQGEVFRLQVSLTHLARMDRGEREGGETQKGDSIASERIERRCKDAKATTGH